MSVCADCSRSCNQRARGLCDACYTRHRKAGTLHKFPRALRRREDVLEDFAFLAGQGYSRRDAAERLGITKQALEKALERERRAREVAS